MRRPETAADALSHRALQRLFCMWKHEGAAAGIIQKLRWMHSAEDYRHTHFEDLRYLVSGKRMLSGEFGSSSKGDGRKLLVVLTGTKMYSILL